MEETERFIRGRDYLSLLDLFNRAAEKKGLKLREIGSRAFSESIATCRLNSRLLLALEAVGIKRIKSEEDVFTLEDVNQTYPEEKRLANRWSFLNSSGRNQFDLTVNLCFRFKLGSFAKGVSIQPISHGTFLSASDSHSNFRMFKVLVENSAVSHPLAQEMMKTDGVITVPWSELDLEGIKEIWEMFSIFIRDHGSRLRLSAARGIFDPEPFRNFQKPNSEIYVLTHAQTRLLEIWTRQLDEHLAGQHS